MSPIRHEDDFQRRPIQSWDSWIDSAIEEAKERGEFDNLPGHGKPLRIETNPFAPELDMAHSRLKNADMAPAWIELGRTIEIETAALAALLDETAHRLATERARLSAPVTEVPPAPPTPPSRPRWWPFNRRPVVDRAVAAPASLPDLEAFVAERARARERYLERAAGLDKKIREYHDALPANLWHLQRLRPTPERAARDFDAAISPLGSDAWAEETRR
ncbi:MAG: DUF1992 domain-containing protein [Chloroflexia bacterium]|nr:DUF1992 domain-containing protein [Chloroflexia bacterium]